MNRHYQFGGILGGSLLTGAAIICVSAQPARAAATQITNVQVNQTDRGMQVVLQTRQGDRPQVFTVNRGNALIADLINTQLSLPDNSGFVQNNPAPGISSVSVAQLDTNSVRVTVNGGSGTPNGQINQGQRGIVLNVNGVSEGSSANDTSSSTATAIPVPAPEVAQAPAAPAPAAPAVPLPNAPAPDVLVPNPQVTIEGVPVVQPSREAAPPLLPRAVAPPLGDISVSSTDAAPEEINLGTSEIVPRLVLRDAPAREVLSLLARAAGLNVAYLDQAVQAQGPGQAAAPAEGGGAPQDVRISLDIENEPVQNVFNYVLRVANLQANRSGRTIFVGTLLPASARNNIIRTLRLNQVTAAAAASFLSAQGAETQRVVESTTRTVQGEGANQIVTNNTTTQIIPLAATAGAGPLLLRGLSVLTDERLQAVTLVGTPQQVQVAGSLLSQLDLRQRQVAVNIKIVDVNLAATDNLNTSFSFGVGDTFVLSDGGNAFINYGGNNPPNAATAGSSVLSPPAIPNPFAGGNTFLDVDQPGIRIPGTTPGTIIIDERNGTVRRVAASAAAEFLRRVGGVSTDPFETGITDVELAEDTVITIDADGNANVERGEVGTAESGLPSFFRYPTRFLASLQAQVVSGNAKILTDPTLVIQEGQQATVNLGQEVISETEIERVDTPSGTREQVNIIKAVAGLQLQVNVSRIDDNGFVTLAIAPTVSAPVETRQVGDGEVTLLSVRQLTSGQVRIRDGQTLILSGIIQETDRTSVSKVPILGDIPILGALFRRTNRNNTRQEVIVLLTPRVLDDSDFSSFGYRYTPSPEADEILRRQGVQLP
ncbi:type IV pilus secretin family protein [Leptolyngbya sp. FACHB-711]|uniref:type IV pilus secretin family protein n=1 Tax=unclassified Leptolyngbya TaxID=2650499 RepID=UPI00168A0CA4|nr:AMIN domain-containing protein [Cyanobacteria bacterium FACHB-502]MBD2024714.1 AMIN domain-containing protein [Leptolyngbya sp. FACHB-711]